MKSVEFNEDGFGDWQKIAEQLFGNADDPSSFAYKRILVRPHINWWAIALNCIAPILTACGIFALLCYVGAGIAVALGVVLAALLIYISIMAKRIAICMVRIYQHFAPDAVRNKCRFEPSCSEYMILSLQKYGFLKGLHKGIGRLKRCNINNGGYDLP